MEPITYKGYRIEALGTYPMFRIRSGAQGGIPNALDGIFSTAKLARAHIDGYLNSLTGRKKRTQEDGKEEGTSSDK